MKNGGVYHVQVNIDSHIIMNQVKYLKNKETLISYQIKHLIKRFEEINVTHIPRVDSTKTNVLAKLASMKAYSIQNVSLSHFIGT